MTPHTLRCTQTTHRFSSPARGAGRLVAPLLIALTLAFAGPARAHHDIEEAPEMHPGNTRPQSHYRGEADGPDTHYLAHAYGEVKPHQHAYTHTHWHTHVLEDGTIIHHKHPHSHTYWHYGPDETEEERVTRFEPDKEKAAPNEESPAPEAGTRFVKPGTGGSGAAPALY